MIAFELTTEAHTEVLKEIMNSNPEYNLLSEGHTELTDAEILDMYETSKQRGTVLSMVMDGDVPVGVIDYLLENPADNTPWLGLLAIHTNHQGKGYAVAAVKEYERLMRNQGAKKVRLGVIKGNERALDFWKNRGFSVYRETQTDKWTVVCFEKEI